jgi:hypothetical protein
LLGWLGGLAFGGKQQGHDEEREQLPALSASLTPCGAFHGNDFRESGVEIEPVAEQQVYQEHSERKTRRF